MNIEVDGGVREGEGKGRKLTSERRRLVLGRVVMELVLRARVSTRQLERSGAAPI